MNTRHLSAVATFLFVLAFTGQTEAAPRKLMVFARDHTFLPEIIHTLRALKNKDTNGPMFEVTNLNLLTIGRLEVGTLDELLRYYELEPNLRRKSSWARDQDTEVLKLLQQAQAYIRIDVLAKGSFLEFQLIISDSLRPHASDEFPVLVTSDSRYEGFVLDISQPNYRDLLYDALRRIYPATNLSPKIKTTVSNATLVADTYFVSLGRPAVIDASESFDSDSPNKQLRFSWTQINPLDTLLPVPSSRMVKLIPDSVQQEVRFNQLGEYLIRVSCFDGVSWSAPSDLRFMCVTSPFIRSDAKVTSTTYGFSNRFIEFPVVVRSANGRPMLHSTAIAENWIPSLAHRILGWADSREVIWPDSVAQSTNLTQSSGPDTTLWYGKIRLMRIPQHGVNSVRLKIVADDGHAQSDTQIVLIKHRNMSTMLSFDLLVRKYSGYRSGVDEKDSLWSARVAELRYGTRLNFSRIFGFHFGAVLPLSTDKENAPSNFDTPGMYYGFCVDPISFYIEETGQYTGVSWSVEFGKYFGLDALTFEHGIFPHWRSFAGRMTIQTGSEWYMVLIPLLSFQLLME